MTRDVEGVVGSLTETQQGVIISLSDSWITGPVSFGVVQNLCMDRTHRPALCEMRRHIVREVRLTPLGIEVRAHLLAQDKSQ